MSSAGYQQLEKSTVYGAAGEFASGGGADSPVYSRQFFPSLIDDKRKNPPPIPQSQSAFPSKFRKGRLRNNNSSTPTSKSTELLSPSNGDRRLHTPKSTLGSQAPHSVRFSRTVSGIGPASPVAGSPQAPEQRGSATLFPNMWRTRIRSTPVTSSSSRFPFFSLSSFKAMRYEMPGAPNLTPEAIANIRRFLPLLGVVALVLVVVLVVASGASSTRQESSSKGYGSNPLLSTNPNIVIVAVDNLGYNDVGFTNSSQYRPYTLSNIDRMASSGIILTEHYAPPSSTASRCGLLTGRYGTNTGCVRDLSPGAPWGLPLNEFTIAQMLKNASVPYYTGVFGKWHLGHFTKNFLPRSRGFDEFVGQLGNKRDPLTHQDKNGFFDWYNGDSVDKTAEGVDTAKLQIEAVSSFISSRTSSSPFFLYVPTTLSGAYYNTLSNTTASATSSWIYQLKMLDTLMNTIEKALVSHGLLQNTVIIFLGVRAPVDSNIKPEGSAGRTAPLSGSFGTLYEGAVRTPAFVYSPRLLSRVRGTVTSATTTIYDWFPTIASWIRLRVSLPNPIDGVSLSDVLFKGDSNSNRKTLITMDTGCTKATKFNTPTAAFRYGRYKLIIDCVSYYGIKGNMRIYDLKNDPSESTDLLNDSTFQENVELITEMQEYVVKMATSSTAQPFINESPFGSSNYACAKCSMGCALNGVWGPFYSTNLESMSANCASYQDDDVDQFDSADYVKQ
eukprot:c12583_g1_i1.p1 GENE.c12583_g1_i1~~c12583_g1_i1.p1  ORF type:complete len:726 (+),score=152.87 c12583_g1_i1:164-2341(+)